MKKYHLSRLSALLLIMFSFTLFACSSKKTEQAKMNYDKDYFIGLRLLQEGNEKDAKQKFIRCKKNGSYYCAKKSAEALVSIGDVQERNTAAENLVEQFSDEDSLLIAVKQFNSSEEINKVIELTKDLDFKTAKNELIKIRLECLKKRGDSSYQNEVFNWFTECNISKEHYQFYRDTYEHSDMTPQQFIIDYRIQMYKRDYLYAFSNSEQLLEYFDNGTIEPIGLLASDLGKAFLYGDTNFSNNGAKFQKLAEKYKGTDAEFFFWFYSGRLYEKSGIYFSRIKNSFESAIKSANNNEQEDNAFWYLLNATLVKSVEEAIKLIEDSVSKWHDPYYFEDFFEDLVSPLLIGQHWDAFYRIYKALDGVFCDEVVAQYAYIYGRLAQENLAKGTDDDIQEAFERACKSGTAVYYKVMAAYSLGLNESELDNILCAPMKNIEIKVDESAEYLLEGYVKHGFPELIYENWLKLQKNGLSQETNFYLADFLIKCSNDNHEYGVQGTRIASKGVSQSNKFLSKEQLKTMYPTLYSNLIETNCEKYYIPKSVMYALVRSESFFNEDVTSNAGAVGLTQLMETTGLDIARKLRIQDYELTDPNINVEFGTFYLADLIRRCDNSIILALLSYNTGITRIRRWIKSNRFPMDLFLETLPYKESRGYGKKLISATSMYEYLYSKNDSEEKLSALDRFNKTVETLLK